MVVVLINYAKLFRIYASSIYFGINNWQTNSFFVSWLFIVGNVWTYEIWNILFQIYTDFDILCE